MKLFSASDQAKIIRSAQKSKQVLQPPKVVNTNSMSAELKRISESVIEYFRGSSAVLITSKEQLHDYITALLEAGIAGIDTETTGLDRIKDYIVGASLYYPGGVECYIPIKHRVPIFEDLYKGQLTYEDVREEFQRIVDSNVKLVFANADFDLAMIYKDIKVDFKDRCWYDVIIAWRCLKENEPHNGLKELYNKYVLKGKGNPKRFSDFFPPALFPYCKPEVSKLYAANDAKITYELCMWQLPYLTKDHPKCKKSHLERIADLVWNVEFPLIKVCHVMHRTGMYLDLDVCRVLMKRYNDRLSEELAVLQEMVQDVVDHADYVPGTKPFTKGTDFNPKSPLQVKYLVYKLLKVPDVKNGTTDKDFLKDLNLPVTNQILKVRSTEVLINTFVNKLPNSVTPDSRIHGQFKQIGADTGRFSSANPNLQNIPSKVTDIRHMFRATPGYVMLSSDYSAQEPRLTSYVSNDPKMIKSFQEDKDIYGTIASVAFELPYDKCLEFNPETGEYQPDGKKRRTEAKAIVLGITYGRSVPSIADQLYGTRDDMKREDKIKKAQDIYDSVLKAFPNLRQAMINAQAQARDHGYVETILGRRRHLPNMMLPPFQFEPMPGYINPDIDPLDPSTLTQQDKIPKRVVDALSKEFDGYKYFGQKVKRIKELAEQKIKVINNEGKIGDASRLCLNSIIQGSAADQTKMAILLLENNEEWKQLGGRLLTPVHDELICEIPIENAERGAELLSSLMVQAADFLPFSSKCDVEISYRWYGLSYPCPYPEPKSLNNMGVEEIKWVQYHIIETEVLLPVFPDENGEKPRGDAAKGVNGIMTDELNNAIQAYMKLYDVDENTFIPHIKRKVEEGLS